MNLLTCQTQKRRIRRTTTGLLLSAGVAGSSLAAYWWGRNHLDAVLTRSDTSRSSLEAVLVGLAGVALTVLIVGLWSVLRSRRGALRTVDRQAIELRHQSMHDALTGLPNRALLYHRAAQLIGRAERHPQCSGVLAAIYVDLDNFKEVNESLGLSVGDEVLKQVAGRIVGTVRRRDLVARVGADEFLVLAEGSTDGSGALKLAERILAAVAEPLELQADRRILLRSNASAGIAVRADQSAEDLVRDADVARGRAKRAGKGRCVVFDPDLDLTDHQELQLEIDLRLAVDHDELFVLYQPIFNLDNGSAKGVEALLRWRHPSRGVVSPAAFIPIAERSGLIVDIGRYVLDRATEQAAAWQRQGAEIGVSVNVSALQLDSLAFLDDVCGSLADSGLHPTSLTLEITESALVHDVPRASSVLSELKRIGVRIAIDDFGTGYSALAYLRQFPVDSLKIDRSFIVRAALDVDAAILLHSLVQLGRSLGIETVAEGIEDGDQLVSLRNEHCDCGQGFLLAHPLFAEGVLPFLVNHQPAGITGIEASPMIYGRYGA